MITEPEALKKWNWAKTLKVMLVVAALQGISVFAIAGVAQWSAMAIASGLTFFWILCCIGIAFRISWLDKKLNEKLFIKEGND
jgi:hypothetical protein